MNIRMNNQLLGKIGVVWGAVMLALLACGFFGLVPNPVWHVADAITVAFCLTLGWRLQRSANSGADTQ